MSLLAYPSRAAGAIDVLVIGAGHAGLAMSYFLSRARVDHVVLERGEVANSWRRERWDSLRLLTPNWQTRLPGKAYAGDDPDGFMAIPELVDTLDNYAAEIAAPVQTQTDVLEVRPADQGYRVVTNRGTWQARSVVLATGACNRPCVPKLAADLPEAITQLTPFDYRSPADVPKGGVLIVGASATGLQLARELLEAGRDVTLAAGEHVRMPRRYRGKDIFHWLTETGLHDERYDQIDDLSRGRRLPSPQLVGADDLPILDLNHIRRRGGRITGRLMGVRDTAFQFSGSLNNVCALADLKMQRLLKLIDETADASGAPAGEAFPPTLVDEAAALTLDYRQQNIRSVIWATGFRPNYDWLDVPVLDRKGQLKHDGGVVAAPGLYALGLPLLRRRKSSFIYGIEDDARDLSEHLINYLNTMRRESDGFYRDHSGRRRYRRSA
ncbi:MAG: NAD(P)-binding domain-containing protein [Pseudomonadota bacterium]